MATGYSRQRAGDIASGKVVKAVFFNDEFNALADAFDEVTGHNHDGTVQGGAPVAIADTTGTLALSRGGTGATTASVARSNLGATTVGDDVFTAADADAAQTAIGATTKGKALITAANEAAIRTEAGLGSIATQDANNVSITGGSVAGITDLAVADGGTGASTAAAARTNLSAQEDVITTRGDVVVGDASGNATRLAIGTSDQVLTSDGTDVSWSDVSGLSVGDAQTLDGLDSTQFLRSDANDSASGDLTFSGAVSFTGNVTLGNAATDTVTVTADIDSNLIPSADNTYSLGDASNRWDAFFDDVDIADTLAVDGAATFNASATFNGDVDLGNSTSDTVTFTGRVDSDIDFDADDSRAIGSTDRAAANVNTHAVNGGQLAGMRNVIINGDFLVNRHTTTGTTNTFFSDRWLKNTAGAANLTGGRVTTGVSSGTNGRFQFAAQVSPGAADVSLAAGDYGQIVQPIEGDNINRFRFGTANAQDMTLSFWVKSNLTGTYCVAFQNGDASRSYIAEYTISASNTWEYKTITLTADTTGSWNNSNLLGLQLSWTLWAGTDYHNTANTWHSTNDIATSNQVNFANSTSNTFEITGVQLELGNHATEFEHRGPIIERMLCERYFEMISDIDGTNAVIGSGMAIDANQAVIYWRFRVPKRTTPTVSANGGANAFGCYYKGTNNSTFSYNAANSSLGTNGVRIELNAGAGLTAGEGVLGFIVNGNGSGGAVFADAELL